MMGGLGNTINLFTIFKSFSQIQCNYDFVTYRWYNLAKLTIKPLNPKPSTLTQKP
jgi:hypothetical protein